MALSDALGNCCKSVSSRERITRAGAVASSPLTLTVLLTILVIVLVLPTSTSSEGVEIASYGLGLRIASSRHLLSAQVENESEGWGGVSVWSTENEKQTDDIMPTDEEFMVVNTKKQTKTKTTTKKTSTGTTTHGSTSKATAKPTIKSTTKTVSKTVPTKKPDNKSKDGNGVREERDAVEGRALLEVEEEEEELEEGDIDFISRQLMQDTFAVEGSGTDPTIPTTSTSTSTATTSTATTSTATTSTATTSTATTATTTRASTCTPGLRDSGCDTAGFQRCSTQADGSSQCVCLNGYTFNANGVCVASSRINLILAFLQAFQQAFNNLQDPLTQRFLSQILALINAAFVRTTYSTSYLSATVNSLRQGSIIADIDVSFVNGTALDVASIKAQLEEQFTTNRDIYENLTYFSIDYPPNVTTTDPDECSDIRLNYCSDNATCIPLSATSFTCSCNQGFVDESWNGEAAPGEICVEVCTIDYCLNGGECKTIGQSRYCQCPFWYISERCEMDIRLIILTVGCALGLLVVIVGVVCCVLRKQERSSKKKQFLFTPTTHGVTAISRLDDDRDDDFGFSPEDEDRWIDIAEALSPADASRLYPHRDIMDQLNQDRNFSDTLSSRGSSSTITARIHLPRHTTGELFGRPAPRGEVLAPEGVPFQFPHVPPVYQSTSGPDRNLLPPAEYLVRRRSSAARVAAEAGRKKKRGGK